MDLQFYGANCISLNYKGVRIIIDDNLAELGAKSVTKSDDVALFTTMPHPTPNARLMFDGPGEYEIADISIVGISNRSHMDESNAKSATMYKLVAGDYSVLVTGHVYPDLSDKLLEQIGLIDIIIIPVGGSGYTLDPIGALKLIKEIEPKLIIPTHYADAALTFPVPQIELEAVLREIGMEPRERVTKLKLKPGEITDATQLLVLEKS
jgi:L-ascorbate metabolism protein UlaG (beta-lactamase superfamily)